MITANGTKFEETLFSVSTATGKRRVYGYSCGRLAYHVTKRSGRLGYAITHLPTGLGILEVKRAREARAFIRQANALNWDFDSPEEGLKNLLPCMSIVRRLRER